VVDIQVLKTIFLRVFCSWHPLCSSLFDEFSAEGIRVKQVIDRAGAHQAGNQARTGKVWLVGAGPGDVELLTLKALRAIESADIIFFDYLVSPEIRALFPANVPALYVGKAKDRHSIAQQDLNQLLVSQAQLGLT